MSWKVESAVSFQGSSREGKNGSGKLTVAKRNVSFIETNMTGLGLQERENPISAARK